MQIKFNLHTCFYDSSYKCTRYSLCIVYKCTWYINCTGICEHKQRRVLWYIYIFLLRYHNMRDCWCNVNMWLAISPTWISCASFLVFIFRVAESNFVHHIEYRSDDVTKNFFFGFQCFGYHVSVEHDEKHPQLGGNWFMGARDMAAWIPN